MLYLRDVCAGSVITDCSTLLLRVQDMYGLAASQAGDMHSYDALLLSQVYRAVCFLGSSWGGVLCFFGRLLRGRLYMI